MKKKILNLVLVIIIVTFGFLAFVPMVHASGPTVQQSTWEYDTGATGHCGAGHNGLNNPVAAGDVVVVAIKSGFPIMAVSDNRGNTYTSQVSVARGDGDYQSSIWSAPNSVSQTITITVTLTNGGSDMGIECYDLSGVDATGTALSTAVDAFCSTACSTTLNTGTSVLATGNVAIATYLTVGSSTFNAGASYTKICSSSLGNCGAYDGEYSTTVVGNTNFPATAAANAPQDGVGAIFGLSTVITITTIIPPNPSQIQYWFFPILFLGLYDAIFLTQGLLAKVSTKGMIYLLLCGFTLGSIVGLLMGFIGIQLVILSVLCVFVWWWRFR